MFRSYASYFSNCLPTLEMGKTIDEQPRTPEYSVAGAGNGEHEAPGILGCHARSAKKVSHQARAHSTALPFKGNCSSYQVMTCSEDGPPSTVTLWANATISHSGRPTVIAGQSNRYNRLWMKRKLSERKSP